MRRNRPLLLLGALILLGFAACTLFPAALAPYAPKQMFAPWLDPCAAHPLGTNDLGYDVLTELIYAAGTTLLSGVSAALISLVVGTAAGLAAGYLPGWRGALFGGVIQVFLMIPMLPMAIVVASFAGSSMKSIVLIIALLGWCGTARTVRVRTMQLRQTPFVESLLILGVPQKRIVLRHVLPNLYEVILSRYIMSVAHCIMLEATLSFLGMGDPTAVTWGRMINLAYRGGGFTRGAYHWLVSPGACIALVVIAFYCINQYFEGRSGAVAGGRSYTD